MGDYSQCFTFVDLLNHCDVLQADITIAPAYDPPSLLASLSVVPILNTLALNIGLRRLTHKNCQRSPFPLVYEGLPVGNSWKEIRVRQYAGMGAETVFPFLVLCVVQTKALLSPHHPHHLRDGNSRPFTGSASFTVCAISSALSPVLCWLNPDLTTIF